MRALVLFKGTGSIDRALERYGFKVDSLDIDPKCNATWTSDILTWDAWNHMMPGATTSFGPLPHVPIIQELAQLQKRTEIWTWQTVLSREPLKLLRS